MAVPYSLQMLSLQSPAGDWRFTSSLRMAGYHSVPVVSAANPHCLGGVIVPVEIVAVAAAQLDLAWHVLTEIGDAVATSLVSYSPALCRATTPAAERGNCAGSSLEHVAEAAVGILRLLDVANAGVDGLLGHVEAGVPRGPQGVDLADRHRQVGVAADRLVRASPLVILGSR